MMSRWEYAFGYAYAVFMLLVSAVAIFGGAQLLGPPFGMPLWFFVGVLCPVGLGLAGLAVLVARTVRRTYRKDKAWKAEMDAMFPDWREHERERRRRWA